MTHDSNEDLGPYVEGMVMGAIDLPRLAHLTSLRWSAEVEPVDDTHTLVFTSPSGLRWAIRAVLLNPGEGKEPDWHATK